MSDNGTWRVSSHSQGQGQCVEVASAAKTIMVRDSKNRQGSMLHFTRDNWRTFTESVKQAR
jgi:hypothetical protein